MVRIRGIIPKWIEMAKLFKLVKYYNSPRYGDILLRPGASDVGWRYMEIGDFEDGQEV